MCVQGTRIAKTSSKKDAKADSVACRHRYARPMSLTSRPKREFTKSISIHCPSSSVDGHHAALESCKHTRPRPLARTAARVLAAVVYSGCRRREWLSGFEFRESVLMGDWDKEEGHSLKKGDTRQLRAQPSPLIDGLSAVLRMLEYMRWVSGGFRCRRRETISSCVRPACFSIRAVREPPRFGTSGRQRAHAHDAP